MQGPNCRRTSPARLSGRYTALVILTNGFQVVEGVIDGEGIHFAPRLTGLDGPFEVMAGDLDREGIGNYMASPFVVFHPGRMGQRDPDRLSIGKELDINRIGVASGNGNNESLIRAMNFLA